MRERYPPTPPFHCGENEIRASLISSASVGATPTPATNSREVFRLPVCKTGVAKQTSEVTTGALPAPPTNYWIRSSTSQSNPLSAGRLRVRVPSDPPFYRSVAQYSER